MTKAASERTAPDRCRGTVKTNFTRAVLCLQSKQQISPTRFRRVEPVAEVMFRPIQFRDPGTARSSKAATAGLRATFGHRLSTTEMSIKVIASILAHREVAPLLSDDHFSVDGTLVKA